jgi:hypothetical protein
MQLDRVRRTALGVAVLTAVAAIAVSSGATPLAADSTWSLNAADAGATGASGATDSMGASGASGSTAAYGATGATGVTGTSGAGGATGSSGPTGATGASGTTGASGATSTTGTTSSTGATSSAGATTSTASTTSAAGSTSATGATGSTGTTGPGGASTPAGGASGSSGAGAFVAPAITGSLPQPESGVSAAQPAGSQGSGQGGSSASSGPTAPSPALFAGSNPLAGVLPGSWADPFIIDGGADVPQFYVQNFHIPPFLLAIYQAAGAAYDIPWQTLAAINEVETDYGTDLDVSSAGAVGWMQFLPSTWKRYGVDASASGVRDPYNAADAIFAAARYLAAAGGVHNLPGAIFAYNHSHAYVRSVLLRAELLTGEPSALVNAVSELAEGDFPIQLRYHASYGPLVSSHPTATAGAAAASGVGAAPAPTAVGAAAAAGSPSQTTAEDIFASSGAAIVSAQDGTIIRIGRNRKLGRFVVVRNAFGDRFTYGNLASVSAWYPTPKPPRPSAALLSAAAPAALAPGPHPTAPATAGAQSSAARPSGSLFRRAVAGAAAAAAAPTPTVATINLRSRPTVATLFTPLAVLDRAVRGAAVGRAHHSLLEHYYTGAFGLRPSALQLARLTVGSHVLAGTILGRLAHTTGSRRAHLIFELRPVGPGEAPINPRPFLDAWSQLETLELHRDSFNAPFFGPNLHALSVGTVLVASQVDIERIVLQDTHVTLPSCERTAIADGNVDRRVLATLEVLVLHGIDPTVSGAWCATGAHRPLSAAILKTGYAIALSALDGQPAAGVADVAIKALAGLRGDARPSVSERTQPGQIVISFAPARAPEALAAAASFTAGFALSSTRWSQLDSRLVAIPEPRVPTAISTAALRAAVHGATARLAKHR